MRRSFVAFDSTVRPRRTPFGTGPVAMALMPGVTVRLSAASLMTTRTTLTEEAGAYRFAAVPPGGHTLTFQLPGFGTVVRDSIHAGLAPTAITPPRILRIGARWDW